MLTENPFHRGELEVQQRAAESAMARMNSGAIRSDIPPGAMSFVEQQPMVVISSIDPNGNVWASVLFDQPGFLRVRDKRTLEINLSQPGLATDDPLWDNLANNPNIGLLIIELESRLRLRVNGRAEADSARRLRVAVERAYSNCPKYIQRRVWKTPENRTHFKTAKTYYGKRLTATHKALIARLDTFFVASAHPDHGLDASHRGGPPGFVQVLNDRQLRIPDYVGNSMFNTLGNFASYPHAGLAFVDFERGRLLQLTGRPEILWDQDDPHGETGGTRRYWQFALTGWRELQLAFALHWEFVDYSPYLPTRDREPRADRILKTRVERIRLEAEDIKSFRLQSADGEELPEFQPGAHLPVIVRLSNGGTAERQYSLLSHPSDRTAYEIGVLAKMDGRGGSRFLHEEISPGDILECRWPQNEFPRAQNARHNILIAGGIGITPIFSIMQDLALKEKSFELHYSARSKSRFAFRKRIEKIAGDKAHFYPSHDRENSYLDLEQLLSTPMPGVAIYICGPRPMISKVREIAAAQGWSPSQIHFESFGVQPLPTDRPIRIHLQRSKMSLSVPAHQTILETLLDSGVNAPHDCKRGECGMCVTDILDGDPDHRDLCLTAAERTVSMCVCVSRAKSEELILKL